MVFFLLAWQSIRMNSMLCSCFVRQFISAHMAERKRSFQYPQCPDAVIHAEADSYTCEFKGVYAVGIGMIVWSGIICQNFCQCFLSVGREHPKHSIGDFHIEWLLLRSPLGKAARSVWVCIGDGQVRLDVVYWSPAKHVGTTDVYDRALWCLQFDALNLYARKSDWIGPER